MIKDSKKGAYYETRFEKIIGDCFIAAGYKIQRHVIVKTDGYNHNQSMIEADIFASKVATEYYVEVKMTKMYEQALRRLEIIKKSQYGKPIVVLVTAQLLNEEERKKLKNRFEDILIVDLANLLYILKRHGELRKDLISSLDNAIPDNVKPVKPDNDIFSSITQHDGEVGEVELVDELLKIPNGKRYYRKFEVGCFKALKNIFYSDLTLWSEQCNSNNELYRFDLLCRIKNDKQHVFWNIVEKYFNSKYVIFEFKNYKDKITQAEVYTTEKYLYSKALRNVAFIIAKNGYDDNSLWATKGILRETGKLILLISVDELRQIAELAELGKEPADFLMTKLDKLLEQLEK